MSTFKTLVYKKEGDVATIVLNRPDRLNAINYQMLKDMSKVVKQIDKDKSIRFVILTGMGKSFCVGGDLKEFKKCGPKEAKERSKLAQDFTLAMERSSKVYIAKINGYCLGGGLELAMACDVRLAKKGVLFGQPEVKIGIVPGYGGSFRLQRLIGFDQTKKILLTGEVIKAEKALMLGMVHDVYSAKQLDKETKKLINVIRQNAPGAIKIIKQLLSETQYLGSKKALKIERKAFSKRFGTKEQKEGMGAFLEKRKPKW